MSFSHVVKPNTSIQLWQYYFQFGNSHRNTILVPFCFLIFWLVALNWCSVRADGLQAMHSIKFEYSYEGTNPLLIRADRIHLGAGYYSRQFRPEGTTFDSNGCEASFNNRHQGGLLLHNPLWESDADHAGGWTWESRMKVAASSTGQCFQVCLGDAHSTTPHPHFGVQVWPNRIQGFNGTVLARTDLTSNFVTLRIAQKPDSDEYLIWIDGEFVSIDLSKELLEDVDSSWIGDGSSSVGGTTIIDYIRWTGSGAYSPSHQSHIDSTLKREEPPHVIGHSPSDDEQIKHKVPTYTSQPRDVPDFGLMLNDDGDASFPSSNPKLAMRYRRAMIDALSGTPVKTLMCSVGMGSDTLYYPTAVASVVGWRKTKYDTFHDVPSGEEQMWAQRIQNITEGIKAGIDPVRIAGERARSQGKSFVPSYRMNDDHFMVDPLEYPMTGRFWLENHERLKIRNSPILSDPRYGQLFDFSHAEVREYRLDTIYEIIDRYQDLMDGLELDFNRVQVFFPYQEAARKSHLITEIVAKVRQRLDEVGQRNQKTYYLFARVPPTLENCRWAGLDIPRWLECNLIDVLIPSQLMTLAHDMPLEEFVKLAEPHGAKVYPAIYPRTGYMWPLVADTSKPSYHRAGISRSSTPQLIRGAAANYWHAGASGFQLYNFITPEVPFASHLYRIMRDLAEPACLSLSDKIFAITPSYYLDYEDTYQYRKQLPLVLKSGKTHRLDLIVGEDLSVAPVADQIVLRIGLREVSNSAKFKLILNEHVLFEGELEDYLVATESPPATAPSDYLHVVVEEPQIIRDGRNQLSCQMIHATIPQGTRMAKIVECQLGVFYAPRPKAIFEP